MNDPQRLYEKIYQILITKGVDVLADYIKKRDLDDYAINAIRTLASLPDPRVVTRREAVKIAMECISRSLEFCYQTENIGKLAHQLREQLCPFGKHERIDFFPAAPVPGVAPSQVTVKMVNIVKIHAYRGAIRHFLSMKRAI